MKLQESSPVKPPEPSVKWYMDPRFWLLMVGLLCWIASAFLEGGAAGSIRP